MLAALDLSQWFSSVVICVSDDSSSLATIAVTIGVISSLFSRGRSIIRSLSVTINYQTSESLPTFLNGLIVNEFSKG